MDRQRAGSYRLVAIRADMDGFCGVAAKCVATASQRRRDVCSEDAHTRVCVRACA